MNNKAQVYNNIDLNTFVLEIPNFQRPLNDSHVAEIISTAHEYISKGMGSPFPLLSIARYPDGASYKFCIIDGQHRYRAYKIMYERGFKFNIDIHVINCSDVSEAFKFYQLCNKRMDHSEVQLQSPQQIQPVEMEIYRWINASDQTQLFGPNNCQRPRVRIQTFIDKYSVCNVRQLIKSFDDFRIYLENKNNEEKVRILSNVDIFCRSNDLPNNNIIEKARSINWYLGLSKNLDWLV